MSKKLATLEDFLNKYLSKQKNKNGADTYEEYKYKNGTDLSSTYSRNLQTLYVDALKNSPAYKQNYAKLGNKGLQNSGYREYLADKNSETYTSKIKSLNEEKRKAENANLSGYFNYLDAYRDTQAKKKSNVISHLIKNNVVDQEVALSYAIGQGLVGNDAADAVRNAYAVNRSKVLNTILEQAAGLGLDRDGAVLLAKKMGVSSSDAENIGYEVEELLKYYKNASDSYLYYLEQKSDKTTNTFD